MGLTLESTGRGARDEALHIERPRPGDKIIALAGNPNVGKSTIFNNLTGMKQHTGNWPGKTVSNARGYCRSQQRGYVLVDVPGAYSLRAASPEEELARDFICFGGADAVLLVCDGSCLERNMKLLLQVMETGKPVLLCVNLLDEAESRGIHIDLKALEAQLGLPVIGTVGRDKRSRGRLLAALDALFDRPAEGTPYTVEYPAPVERAVAALLPLAGEPGGPAPRFTALRLLEGEQSMEERAGPELLAAARQQLEEQGLDEEQLHDILAATLVRAGERICARAVENAGSGYGRRDRRIDRIVTSRRWGYPLMIALPALIFFLTISGANVPSQWLAKGLFWVEDALAALLLKLGAPAWLRGLLVDGAFRTLAWVTSVMLPPMAIFFPLFTLLEDSGYLPRIAYNLDRPFCRCGSCGRQALTMAMGFGCNAAGVVGCRIIHSPRERLLAILTNSLVPCNGRFPTLAALISLFFLGNTVGTGRRLLAAGLFLAVILFAVGMTLLCSKLLSVTLLRGQVSSFSLELPPYRMPQIGRVLVRSLLDRTVFVLGRAVTVAMPAGAVLWGLAHLRACGQPLLTVLAGLLQPLGGVMGLDGMVLLAFLLAFPANEIMLPILAMGYLSTSTMVEVETDRLGQILTAHGWSWQTAVCAAALCLLHLPCGTTCLTLLRETGSKKWTLVGMLLPLGMGILVCCLLNALFFFL